MEQEGDLLFEALGIRITERFIQSGPALYLVSSIDSIALQRSRRDLGGLTRRVIVLGLAAIMIAIVWVAFGLVYTSLRNAGVNPSGGQGGNSFADECSTGCTILLLVYGGSYFLVNAMVSKWESKGPYQIVIGTKSGFAVLVSSYDLRFVHRVQEAIREAFEKSSGREAPVTMSGDITFIHNPQSISVVAKGGSSIGDVSQSLR